MEAQGAQTSNIVVVISLCCRIFTALVHPLIKVIPLTLVLIIVALQLHIGWQNYPF